MRTKQNYHLLTFHTTTAAMAMEDYCHEHGIPGRMIPLPQEISRRVRTCVAHAPGGVCAGKRQNRGIRRQNRASCGTGVIIRNSKKNADICFETKNNE